MKTEISLKDLLDTTFTINDNDEMVGSFTLKRINMIGDILTQQNEEIERLNNKINSIFSNFEQFINSYKNDKLDDFFIVLRLSEIVEFYNDLKEVNK